MQNLNRLITIKDPSEKGGVKLKNKFGEESDSIFEKPLKKILCKTN